MGRPRGLRADELEIGRTYVYRVGPRADPERATVVDVRLKRRQGGTHTAWHAVVLLTDRRDPGPWPVLPSTLLGEWISSEGE